MKTIHAFKGIFSVSFLISVNFVFFAFTAIEIPPQENNSPPGFLDSELSEKDLLHSLSLTGKELYEKACATCHGSDGKGASVKQLGLQTPPPDFTDCDFASREPNGDWIAVAHQGGPVRGFSKEMPAFGEALSEEDLGKIMGHIRTFCTNDDWPRGEMNLPRPLVTGKAYPEDEIVLSSFIDMENEGAVMNEFIYERRFGARNQIEFIIPFGFNQLADGNWRGGYLGDVGIGLKRTFYHNIDKGTIFSIAGEVLLPSGDETVGAGKGTAVLEPFVAYGQILPANGFLQIQTGMEYPIIQGKGNNEAFLRAALGKSFNPNPWGRTWSPMVELLGSRELESGAVNHWDIAPQIQVTLNTRQHIMLNVGYRIPVDDPGRDSSLMIYVLWDWFDGGFLEGW